MSTDKKRADGDLLYQAHKTNRNCERKEQKPNTSSKQRLLDKLHPLVKGFDHANMECLFVLVTQDFPLTKFVLKTEFAFPNMPSFKDTIKNCE